MFKFLIFTSMTMILGLSTSNAQQLNVIQVKGNRAIVEVQTGEKLKVGESYAVGKVDGEVSLEPIATIKGTRNYLLGMDLGFSSLKDDTAGARSQMAINTTLKFGWNKKQYEYGPLFAFDYKKTGSFKPTYTWGAGGFGTYNFQPNIIGTELIFSGDTEFVFAQTKEGDASAYNTMQFSVGPFAKWYGISDDHCIRAGLVFSWNRTNPPAGDKTTTGIRAIVGISTYF